MGWTTEIAAKLGIDYTSVGTDLQNATNIFNKWGTDLARSSEQHGENAGGKLVGALEHKLLGSRHLAGALATALGLNIEKIAETIAAGIVGGTKEGLKELERLADERAAFFREEENKNLGPNALIAQREKDLRNLKATRDELDDKAAKKTLKVEGFGEDAHGVMVAQGLTEEEAKTRYKTANEILRVEAEIAEQKKKQTEHQKKFAEESEKVDQKENDITENIEYRDKLNADIDALVAKTADRTLSKDQHEKDALEILEKRKLLEETIAKIGEESAKIEREYEATQKQEIANKEKLERLDISKKELERQIAADKNKVTDRSKLTLAELANLAGGGGSALARANAETQRNMRNTFGENDGLTQAQIDAKEKARKIEELQQQGEEKRKAGDQTGAEAIFNQVGDMRDDLVKSGFTKSTEGDSFKLLQKQIELDGDKLRVAVTDIGKLLKGKVLSQ